MPRPTVPLSPRRVLGPLGVLGLAGLVAVPLATSPVGADPASYAELTTTDAGVVSGVGFTVTGCVDPQLGTADLSGADFAPAGSADQAVLSCSNPLAVTITFAEEVQDLHLALVDAAAHCTASELTLGGDADGTWTVASGLTGAALAGTTLTIDELTTTQGVLANDGALTELVVTGSGNLSQRLQLTFSATAATPPTTPPTTATTTTAPASADPGSPVDVAAAAAATGPVTPTFAC